MSAARQLILNNVARAAPVRTARPFSTTIAVNKSALDQAKEGLEAAQKKAGQAIATGMDAAADAGEKVKDAVTGGKSAGAKAEELKGQAKAEGEKLKGKANAAAQDIKDKL